MEWNFNMAALTNSILVTATLSIICLCRNSVAAASLTCSTDAIVNVLEGTELFTWECQANDIVTTNAIALAIKGLDINPATPLNSSNYRYEIPSKRYTIRTMDLVGQMNGMYSIRYALDIRNVSMQDDGYYLFGIVQNIYSSISNGLIANQGRSLSVYYIPKEPPRCEPSGKVKVGVDNSNPAKLLCSIANGNSAQAFQIIWTDTNGNPQASTPFDSNGRTGKSIEIDLLHTQEGSIFTCTMKINKDLFPLEQDQVCKSGPITYVTQPSSSPPISMISVTTSSPLSSTVSNPPDRTSPPLAISLPILIASAVGGAILLIIIISVCVCFVLRCRRQETSEPSELGQQDQELSPYSSATEKPSNEKLIYADMDLSNTPSSPSVKSPTETPTMYSSVKIQSAGDANPSVEQKVIYADLDISNTPSSPGVKPPKEEPTVYASVKV